MLPSEKCLEILHFNDVYQIEEANSGNPPGFAKFLSKFNEIKAKTNQESLLSCFSGDLWSPSKRMRSLEIELNGPLEI